MPYDVHLKSKDGTIRTDFTGSGDQLPSIGDEILCSAGDRVVKAKVTDIHETRVGAEVGQPLTFVDAEEI